MNFFVLGGSRHIGYEASVRLLNEGNTITFLLRRKSTFDEDPTIQKFIKSGQVNLSVGDALNEEDVRNAWKLAAGASGRIDAVLFSIGGTPHFSLLKGVVLDPPNLVTRGMLNLLATWPKGMSPQPKLIAVTAHGLTKRSHVALPFLLKPLYRYLLRGPHEDKLGVERLIFQASGSHWTESEPTQTVLPSNWKELVPPNWLQDVLIVRPALLTDGQCVADTKTDAYRLGPETLASVWTVSRKDVAHFIASKALQHWDDWKGQQVSIAY